MFHRLEHLLGWNTGKVVAIVTPDRMLLVGFMCDKCAEITGVHESYAGRLGEVRKG